MPVSVSAPSLPEARNVNRDHYHQHSHGHNHNRFHNRNLNDSTNSNHPHIHSQHHRHSGKRNPQQSDNSDVVVIVETVSIVEVIDATGSIIEIQTLPPDAHTTGLALPPAETTIDVDTSVELPGNLTSSSSVSLPSIVPTGDSGDDTTWSSSAYNSTIAPTVTTSSQSEFLMSPFPTLSYSPITSAPLSQGSGFPTFPGVTNSSQALSTSLANYNSVSVLSFTSSDSGSPSSSSPFTTLSTSSSNLSSFSESSSVGTTSSTATSSASSSTSSAPTTSASDATFVGGAGEDSSPSSPSSEESDSGSSDGPPAGTVAGSIIGGIAGLAFIVLLALAFIRWRKRQSTLKLMGGSGGERGVSNPLPGDSGPGGSGGMSEQPRSAPFAVPAALASLTSHKGASPAPEGEKGFQKISGRKLPSVITSGGDGYTDPRATFMSDDSQASYRDSHAFFSGLNMPRFAVGSPMRPESGIPVFHAGPSKTPVTEQGPFNPFTDNSYPLDSSRKDTHLEPPQRDPLGRSHPSQDGSTRSHGSGSRFTENI